MHLAQVNIAHLRHELDHPAMADFVDNIDYINALAEASEGFIWRFQTEAGHALDERPLDDPTILFNLSVWSSLEDLQRYVYHGDHLKFLQRKKEWFHTGARSHLVLWWVSEGHRPSVAEATERLDRLVREGPGPEGFTFSRPFDVRGREDTPKRTK